MLKSHNFRNGMSLQQIFAFTAKLQCCKNWHFMTKSCEYKSFKICSFVTKYEHKNKVAVKQNYQFCNKQLKDNFSYKKLQFLKICQLITKK